MPEITLGDYPSEIIPQIVTPRRGIASWCAYPGDNPLGSTTESADRDRRRSRRHIYSPPVPAQYIKKFAADTKAYSLITRSQLTAARCLPWFLIKAAWATYSKVKSLHQRHVRPTRVARWLGISAQQCGPCWVLYNRTKRCCNRHRTVRPMPAADETSEALRHAAAAAHLQSVLQPSWRH